MLKNIIPRTLVELVEQAIEFTDAEGCGFSFPCDRSGNVQFSKTDAEIARVQREHYKYAMAHPELFPVKFNQVITRRRTYIEPAHGTCRCGEDITLVNEYQGACQCPKCGQWYNLFGQELIDPEYWEE